MAEKLGTFSRVALFTMFSALMALLALFWWDVVQAKEHPLFPAFPRELCIYLPLAGWILLVVLFPSKSFAYELPRIMRISVPLGLGLGMLTLGAREIEPLLLVLPILIPAVMSTIYTTAVLREQEPHRISSGLLFFAVFSLFYMIAYSTVIVLPMATPIPL